MRPNLFNAKMAKTINKALGPLVLPAILIKVTKVQDSTDSTKVTSQETPYPARGFKEKSDVKTSGGTLVARNVNKISLLGGSLPDDISPVPGDKITIEGVTSKIAEDGVSRDPAGALFECQTF